ncbi:MAG: DUF5947 family protein [Chloroflexota bacterium]|nr:DUF5947 family protein [Chloroflexota bacterium]
MNARTTPLGSSRLGKLAQRSTTEREAAREHCDLCSAPLAPEHRHVLNLVNRELMCACQPCSLLFDRSAAGGGHYRLVGDRRLAIDDFQMSDLAWEELRIPVEIAFFFHSSSHGRVMTYYPSPMGPTESLLGLEAWKDLEKSNPVLATLEPDVEALLVNRARGARQHWVVPVSECYALVGLIRTRWRGLTGGKEVWEAIAEFFEDLDGRSRRASRNHGQQADAAIVHAAGRR